MSLYRLHRHKKPPRQNHFRIHRNGLPLDRATHDLQKNIRPALANVKSASEKGGKMLLFLITANLVLELLLLAIMIRNNRKGRK